MDGESPPTKDSTDKSDQLTVKDELDHAMKNFLFIADQRLKVFNFYVILLAASVGVTATMLQSERFVPASYVLVGATHLVIPVVFYLIERRNIRLLNLARTTLMNIEKLPTFPRHLAIFTADSLNQKTEKTSKKPSSYEWAFRIAYSAQGVLGLIVVALGFFWVPTKSKSTTDSTRSYFDQIQDPKKITTIEITKTRRRVIRESSSTKPD